MGWVKLRYVSFVVAVLASACSGPRSSAPPTVGPWARQPFLIGSAVRLPALTDDPTYAGMLGTQFDVVTPENEMKWETIHPQEPTYNFGPADTIVDFALRNGMKVRGGPLVWHQQDPSWLENGNFSRQEMISILHDHINTVVGRYRGKVAQWDVVNEAVQANGRLRDTFWLRRIGPDYIAMAFRFAHEADPTARLFYNDFDAEGAGTKSDAIYRLVANLRRDGVPIDGVGLQMHTVQFDPPLRSAVATNMGRLRALGLEVAITEMDVALILPPTPDKLNDQARIFASMLSTCLAAPNCRTFVMWGFTDLYSWIPAAMPGFGDALIYDQDYLPKPAYSAVHQVLGGLPSEPLRHLAPSNA